MDQPSTMTLVPLGVELNFDSAVSVSGTIEGPGAFPLIARDRALREREESRRRSRDVACRILNVAIASVLLVLFLPLMAVLALLVGISSRGPVFYKQERVGLDRRRGGTRREGDRRQSDRGGRIFTIYKFRTMYMSESEAPQVWARKGDPRVTPVGRFLRAYRLDELPQLLNVLRGDMNLVGPRPEQPEIFEQLRETIETYPRRQQVLPGITGWAQVNRGYDETLQDVKMKLRYDLEYLNRRTVVEDLIIMARTPSVMLSKEGSP